MYTEEYTRECIEMRLLCTRNSNPPQSSVFMKSNHVRRCPAYRAALDREQTIIDSAFSHRPEKLHTMPDGHLPVPPLPAISMYIHKYIDIDLEGLRNFQLPKTLA